MNKACLPVEDLSSLNAASYLVPNEKIVFALATTPEGDGELVFISHALLIAETMPSYMPQRDQPGKSVERFEYETTSFSGVTFRSHPGCKTVNTAALPRFTVESVVEDDRKIVIGMQDQRMAQAYYKALVLLVRETEKYSALSFGHVERLLANEAAKGSSAPGTATNHAVDSLSLPTLG